MIAAGGAGIVGRNGNDDSPENYDFIDSDFRLMAQLRRAFNNSFDCSEDAPNGLIVVVGRADGFRISSTVQQHHRDDIDRGKRRFPRLFADMRILAPDTVAGRRRRG